MSPIESFIRARPDTDREAAFQAFLDTPRIRQWTNGEQNRVDRLRAEFERAWDRVKGTATDVAPSTPEPEPAPAVSSRAASGARQITPQKRKATPEPESPAPAPAPTHTPPDADAVDATAEAKWARFGRVTHSVMCPKCGSTRLHAHTGGDVVTVQCAQCDAVYGDLLELIPVRRVGPFAFLFGDGLAGVGTAVGLGTALVLAYGVLKWLV